MLELNREASDPQIVLGARCIHAMVMLSGGRGDQALDDWAVIMAFGDAAANTLSQGDMPRFAWLAVDLGFQQEALAVADACDSPSWARVGRAILTGELDVAIDLLDQMGMRPDRAFTQLRAGGEHARDALRFYESVGATRYAQQALAVLENSA
jgi:hypothetical protein